MTKALITGVGAVCPLGWGIDKCWDDTVAGRSGTARLEIVEVGADDCKVAGQVPARNGTGYESSPLRLLDFYRFAETEALAQAGLERESVVRNPRARAAVASHGFAWKIDEFTAACRGKTVNGIDLSEYVRRPQEGAHEGIGADFSERYSGITTACSAGGVAVLEAGEIVRSGLADIVITGGVDANINEVIVAIHSRMGVLTRHNSTPESASRPFDVTHAGFVIAEGAAVLVVESERSVEARGAQPIAELAGWGTAVSTAHLTAGSEGGEIQALAMQRALDSGGASVDDIDYINMHGTSTEDNDISESEGVRKVFGKTAPPVSSTKGVTGHLLGGAGALEAVFGVMAIHTSTLPPTANLNEVDPRCSLDDYIADGARHGPCRGMLTNSFGLAGSNASLLLRQP
ncbi:MAG: beta-ketoacyl-[acyl-carrier-protein] synthase family protein [Acidimicrobiia bacterium]|nr:beta-ketoacyl-[acyl-carrier-protein] synthase family protein [Acidimicrobiia bacterium]MYC58227.1 beta-ketoacyl-[acyl-carrier-protein] synthase family protein [Acidimicrobiia bacterium]MYG93629.1 beta-ketoacyl-[acyl-carrier-protein] synthase family protein [Acidimicrobiia bacterium]MYI30302.1 beta-ketoacyl-[acyl-carrier-protein] synthase family protein [Acidimicrobiia bacterium]